MEAMALGRDKGLGRGGMVYGDNSGADRKTISSVVLELPHRTRSNSITGNLLGMQILRHHSRPTESGTLGRGSSYLF